MSLLRLVAVILLAWSGLVALSWVTVGNYAVLTAFGLLAWCLDGALYFHLFGPRRHVGPDG